ncbi:unnamed protein product [Ascophyllum nodosum]
MDRLNEGHDQDANMKTFNFQDDSYAREVKEEQPLGDRIERLSHGAGPSRRRGRRTAVGDIVQLARINDKTTVVDTRATGEGGKKRRLEEKKGTNNINTNTGTATEKRSSSKPQRRANKNRPQEVSSSRGVGRFREVVVSKRKASRDPRFEGGGGSSKLNYDIFRKAYGFLEAYQDSEIEELKQSLKKEKDQERSSRVGSLLTRLQQESRAERYRGDRARGALRQSKTKERQAVADGKKPYYLKNSDKKRLSQEQRYEGLKEQGKLGKFMEKKRKRNAAKDHRWLPAKRQDKG